MSQERRRRSRVQLQFPLTVIQDDSRIRGKVIDVSLKGLSCETESWLLPSKECDVVLELDSGIRMHVHGRILRSGVESAIDFISMDETSFMHLRNLVRLYAEDADAVDEELRHPAFEIV